MTRKFFEGIEGNQDRPAMELLPTTKRNGAPPDSKYLFQMVEGAVEVRHSGDTAKHPGHPFINYQAEVLEPADFAGRSLFGMLYYPADLDDDATEKDQENYTRQCQQFVGAVDAILGEGMAANVEGDSLEDVLADLADELSGETFIGKVGIVRAKDSYPAKNRITYYYPSSEWEGETNSTY